MIDQRIVGTIVAGQVSSQVLNTADANFVARQRIATPVYEAVNAQILQADPTATTMLADHVRRARVQSMLLVDTANRVVQMFDQAGIPALVYKGVAQSVALGVRWQGRESDDVDVLIAEADVARAHEVLADHGLSRADGNLRPPSRLFRYHEIEVSYAGLPASLDLHWRLESPGYMDIPFTSLWDRRRELRGDGLRLTTLGSEDALLLSAVHGSRERWRSLRHMLDTTTLLAALPRAQWPHVAQLAHESGAARSLAVALAVAQMCGLSDLPARPGPWAESMASMFLMNWARQVLASDATGHGGQPRLDSPIRALHRRIDRWQLSPRPSTRVDALARALVRQAFHQRSWRLRGSSDSSQAA